MTNICTCCYDEALALMLLPQGCYAYPHNYYMFLCGSHLAKIQPRDGIYLVESYVLETERLPGGPYEKVECAKNEY